MKLLLGLFLVSAVGARATHLNNGQGYVNNQEYPHRQQRYSISDGQGRTYEYSQIRTKDTGRGIDITREDRKYIDNSINRNGADVFGASSFQIGHQREAETRRNVQRGQQQVVEGLLNNGRRTDGTSGERVDYNRQRTVTVNIHRTRGNGQGTDLRVLSFNSQYTNDAINMQNINFQGTSNFQVGYRGKRDEVSPLSRQKRGYYNVDVSYSNDNKHDKSINLNGARFQGANSFNIERRQLKRDVEADKELSRQKRGYFNTDVHYSNKYKDDESINIDRTQFGGNHHFNNIEHLRGRRDTETEQMVPREKSQYLNAEVEISNSYAHDKSIKMNGAQFQGVHQFNIGHRGKRKVEAEQAGAQRTDAGTEVKIGEETVKTETEEQETVDESLVRQKKRMD